MEQESNRSGKGKRSDGASSEQHVTHPLKPIFDEHSRVLVLGTMPSPRSRAEGFYYAHPQNRFWRVLSALFGEPIATTNDRRRDQLLRHHIALWDVLASCEIEGASDASISNAIPNDLSVIFNAAPIEAVFCTGAKAAELYARLCETKEGLPASRLPSTSPANATVKFEELVTAYQAILPHLHEPVSHVLDVSDVVALEKRIDAAGTSLAELMERAGLAVAHHMHERFPNARVAVMCGNGNNGGDGWVAARELAARGHEVSLLANRLPAELKAQPAHDAAMAAYPALREQGALVAANPSKRQAHDLLSEADVIIDALLGTGFAGSDIKSPFDNWIKRSNAQHAKGAHVIAVDVPSGMNAQTGKAGLSCVEADETLTMMVLKPGLKLASAAPYCGDVNVVPLAYLEPHLM